MELVAIGGLPGPAWTAVGTDPGVSAGEPGAAAPTPGASPEPPSGAPSPGLHAPAEPSLPPPWALSGPRAVAELLTRERAVFAAAHVAYHMSAATGGGEPGGEPSRRLAL
jgi:hypothetical protein